MRVTNRVQRCLGAAVSFALLLACVPGTLPAPAAKAPQVPQPSQGAQASQLPVAPVPAVEAARAPEVVASVETVRTGMASAEPALASFTGRWQSHSFMLDIDAQGTGAAAWRTYRWCSGAPPPCDDMRGNLITPGGRATFVVRDAGDRWADIDVAESSDPAAVPLGPARLALLEDGRLRLIVESIAAAGGGGARGVAITLCRPGAARSTACGA